MNSEQKPVETAQNEVVINDDQIICSLTNQIKKISEKELTLQSMIDQMIDEYKFMPEDMERDFKVVYEDTDEGKKKTRKVDLAMFEPGKAHDAANMIRFVIVAKDSKVKPSDPKSGVETTIEPILNFTNCEFGCWTNGEHLQYMHSFVDDFDQVSIEALSDFPMAGQTLEDMERLGDRSKPRTPANETLVKTFNRCHDYIYGNEGMKKTAFWELLNLIFCKIYDEKRRNIEGRKGISYRRKFWVGVKELNNPEGQKAVARRIKDLFEELKEANVFSGVFDGNEQINLSDRGLAYVASELSKYSFLDATVDIKGTAYETIVSNTLKQEAGQFFTPRNIIKCMVEILDPDQNTRILDPACGSGGFLVTALDHVRKKIVANMFSDLDELHRQQHLNDPEVDDMVRDYASRMVFGFDFDPDLKKAARMNMVMAGDGHSNIFHLNSLDYPYGDLADVPSVAPAVMNSIRNSADKYFPFATADNNAQGKFDMIFTNPPFGAKVEVDPEIARRYNGDYHIGGNAPEVLFLEAGYNFLKPGGKMAIVLPDGILGNPNHEQTRKWILKHFKLIASIDLPVEAFLPQVGVQASLLFLQKKTEQEEIIPIEEEDYDVFMAIVEKVGKDRRGVPIYLKDDDGADLLFDETKRWISTDENGREVVRSRRERKRRIADDLPEVAKAFKEFKENLK